MAKQWYMTFLPDKDGNKLKCTYTDIALDTPGTDISLYVGDTVPLYRQSEIKNAWKWLYQGIKSRNLLDSQFSGAVLYSGASINALTINNRRTASDIATFNDDDVAIAIGLDSTLVGDVNFLEEAFTQLIEFAAEETLKAA